jgi:hypothetical protein
MKLELNMIEFLKYISNTVIINIYNFNLKYFSIWCIFNEIQWELIYDFMEYGSFTVDG